MSRKRGSAIRVAAIVGTLTVAMVVMAWHPLHKEFLTEVEVGEYTEDGEEIIVTFDRKSLISGENLGVSLEYYSSTRRLRSRSEWNGNDEWEVTVWDKEGKVYEQNKFVAGQWGAVFSRDEPPWAWCCEDLGPGEGFLSEAEVRKLQDAGITSLFPKITGGD